MHTLILVLLCRPPAPPGDPERGKQIYEATCIACHGIDASSVGPAHRRVVGRRAGSLPGFDYSSALKTSKLVWTRDSLDRWLTNPEQLIPGQKMWFTLSDATARRDVIAYLATLQ